jgi:hypothetical protein
VKFFRYLFSYVAPEPLPQVPEEEQPDPNAERVLNDSFRAARRNLVALCGICIAWASAQLTVKDLAFDAGGLSVDLSNATVPILLGAALFYLTAQWVLEFAMMPRNVRRWRLAQLDFRLVSVVMRFALLAVAAGALNRSLRTVILLLVGLLGLAMISGFLFIILMFVTTPVRMWARSRAGRVSAANAVIEGEAWAVFFAILLTAGLVVGCGIASYCYMPLRNAFWPEPPSPIALSMFVAALVSVFLSHWFLRPVFARLFAERPPYRTKKREDGKTVVTFVDEPKEPLL